MTLAELPKKDSWRCAAHNMLPRIRKPLKTLWLIALYSSAGFGAIEAASSKAGFLVQPAVTRAIVKHSMNSLNRTVITPMEQYADWLFNSRNCTADLAALNGRIRDASEQDLRQAIAVKRRCAPNAPKL